MIEPSPPKKLLEEMKMEEQKKKQLEKEIQDSNYLAYLSILKEENSYSVKRLTKNT